MEAELKEILNDLDSLRQSLPDPSSIYMLQSRDEHLTKLAKSAPARRTKVKVSSMDALPEGLTRELPTADEFQKAPAAEPATTSFDDIEELRKQLDALNAD